MTEQPDPETPQTLLITLTGKDRPGVTSSIFGALSKAGVEVLDIEQIVLRRRLILGVLVTAPRDWRKLQAAVTRSAEALGMHVEIDRGTGDNRTRREGRAHVTVIGLPLKASAFAAVAGRIADSGANIDRIERMARYPVTAIDLHVSGVDPERLRGVLATEAARQGIDIAVQPANLLRRGMRLIVMDVDSTIIQGEVIEMLAAEAGCEAEVARVTEQAMLGELDFEESLRSRVALLAGLEESALDRVYEAIVLTPGVRTLVRTLRRLGYRFALVSGGFSQITDRLARDLKIHYSHANELEIVDGGLTGRIAGDIVDRAGKQPRCVVSPGRWASTTARSSPSVTEPTTSTCSTQPDLASPTTPNPSSAMPPTQPSTCPTWTPSCICWASHVRRSWRQTLPSAS